MLINVYVSIHHVWAQVSSLSVELKNCIELCGLYKNKFSPAHSNAYKSRTFPRLFGWKLNLHKMPRIFWCIIKVDEYSETNEMDPISDFLFMILHCSRAQHFIYTVHLMLMNRMNAMRCKNGKRRHSNLAEKIAKFML